MKYFFFYSSFIFVGFLVSLSFPTTSHAGTFSLTTDTDVILIGERTRVTVSISEYTNPITAIEGSVVFSKNVALVGIDDGNSIINFWVEKPDITTSSVAADFAGIIPGGYVGIEGKVLTLLFEGQEVGDTKISLSNMNTVSNDSAETIAQTIDHSVMISVVGEGQHAKETTSEVDTEIPETFIPQIGRDPSVFEGKWFVAFSTQDKKSGIDEYAVLETVLPTWRFAPQSRWIPSESPYVLHNQGRRHYVHIRATDRSGNIRIETVSPLGHNILGGILVAVSMCILVATAYVLSRRFRGMKK
jgi:hypothetical protein